MNKLEEIIHKNESQNGKSPKWLEDMVKTLPTVKEIRDAEDHYQKEVELNWQKKFEREWEELTDYLDGVGIDGKGLSLLKRVKALLSKQ